MSSRPATPTEDITPSQQTESIRRTRSQTRRSQLSDSRRDMIATVQYQGHSPYLHPPHHHPLQDFSRHEQSTATGQPRDLFAPPGFTFDTSYNASAVTAAPLAISSGGMEGRREVAEDVKSGSQKHGHATDFDVGARHRHVSSLEESRGQTSTENETTGETRSPAKKKRTRTLTTSNQSSVLLALLAKTPFPTTAEREEVGRAIGLTARKVQVWFQNQRQKQKKSGQTGSSMVAPQGATTSAPLPLSRQPGFSALHAARMDYHGQGSPPYTPSGIAPYPAGSGSHGSGRTGHFDPSPPPISQAPSRGQIMEPYQSSTAYSRSFPDEPSYYPLRPGTAPENEQYPRPVESGSGHAFTGHSTLPQPSYITGEFHDPFGHRLPHSREESFGYPPPSQEPSVSSDQSRPTTSRGGQHYRPSSDSWRSKPLPPLPPDGGRPATAQPLGWEHNPAEQGFQPPSIPSRSRAFSNPDPAAEGYGPIRPFAPIPPVTTAPPSSTTFASSRFYPPTISPESVAPGSYHAPSEYHSEEAQRMRHAASGSMGDQYTFRYADQFSSPGGVSSSSSLSISEAAALGLSGSSQHPPSSVSYSPLEQRRHRLSYDSSLAGGSHVGKRSWSTDEGRATKRARTDDGHVSLPLRSSTRALPPTAYQTRTSSRAPHGIQELHMPATANPFPPQSEDSHHSYHYEPTSDPASGV